MTHTQISIKRQIDIYVKKCFRIFLNEKGWKIFFSTAIITILITYVTSDQMFVLNSDTRCGAFALVCACIWIGIFNSIQSICKERDIIKREYRAGLSITAYVLAHFIFEAVLCIIEAIIVTAIVYITNIDNIPTEGVVLPAGIELYISFFLAILAADALALLVSSIVKTPNTAMTVMPFVLIIQLVMSGFIFALEGSIERVAELTISKWSLNAICATSHLNDLISWNYLPEEVYESTWRNLSHCWSVLILFVVGYIILAIISLKFVDRDKR